MTARDVVKLIIKILRYAVSESEKLLREDDLSRLASDSRRKERHSG